MKEPQPTEIEAAEVEQLMAQAQQGRLTAQEQQRLVPLLKTLLWLQQTLLTTRISLTKLKRLLFGKRTEKRQRPAKGPNTDSDDGASGSGGTADTGTPSENQGMASSPPTSTHSSKDDQSSNGGHGRRAAADYDGAEWIVCPVVEHQPGAACPLCAKGRLYDFRSLVRLRFTGQPLAQVTGYELGQLRCNTCGALWVASMPPEAPPETYDISLKVNLAVAHYQLGLPFKRIEAFQALECPILLTEQYPKGLGPTVPELAGLLAEANRGILYVDEVNLLDDHLVDLALGRAAADGEADRPHRLADRHLHRLEHGGEIDPLGIRHGADPVFGANQYRVDQAPLRRLDGTQ